MKLYTIHSYYIVHGRERVREREIKRKREGERASVYMCDSNHLYSLVLMLYMLSLREFYTHKRY